MWRNRRNSHPRHSLALLGALASLTIVLAVPSATRTNAHDRHDQKKEVPSEEIQGRRIPDVRLTDQNGRQMRFLSDVLRQRTAVISFIYTSCQSTCPLVGATVASVTEQFQKDDLNLAIVSVSVDPGNDTPERLLAWRERYGDIPHWTLLTGPKREIEQLLRALGAYSANLEDHSEILLVGPNPAGKWTRMSSLAAADKVAAVIRAATAPAK